MTAHSVTAEAPRRSPYPAIDHPLLKDASPRLHTIARAFGCHVQRQCVRWTILNRERIDAMDRVLLAPTHVGHLEPFFLSMVRQKPVHWMTRREFYGNRISAWALRKLMTFPVHRQGIPVSSIRCAMALVNDDRTVGIFPEGGVARGKRSMMHGAPAKGGVCVVSLRTRAPILPIAVVGVEKLSAVRPWIPYRRGRIWINIGEPLEPPRSFTRHTQRSLRRAMTEELASRYVSLRSELDALPDGPSGAE